MYLLDSSSFDDSVVVVFDLILLAMNKIVAGESSQYSRGINFAGEWKLLHCR